MSTTPLSLSYMARARRCTSRTWLTPALKQDSATDISGPASESGSTLPIVGASLESSAAPGSPALTWCPVSQALQACGVEPIVPHASPKPHLVDRPRCHYPSVRTRRESCDVSAAVVQAACHSATVRCRIYTL